VLQAATLRFGPEDPDPDLVDDSDTESGGFKLPSWISEALDALAPASGSGRGRSHKTHAELVKDEITAFHSFIADIRRKNRQVVATQLLHPKTFYPAHKKDLPILELLARQYLCSYITSVRLESFFSFAKRVQAPARAHMHLDRFRALALLKANYKRLPEKFALSFAKLKEKGIYCGEICAGAGASVVADHRDVRDSKH